MTQHPLSPGSAIRDRLAAKGWTQSDLAQVIGKTVAAVNEIIQGKRGITPDTAVDLSAAFNETPEFWLDLESRYRLSINERNAEPVRKRARLFEQVPVKELENRGWIPKTKDLNELEAAVANFLGNDADESGAFGGVSFRRSIKSDASNDSLSPSQYAWLCRARNIADSLPTCPYAEGKLDECITHLRKLAAFPQEVRKVPETLERYGIRLLVIEPLSGSAIDGAAFWLGRDKPVIAITLRFDRIDSFWFTLCHELSHIRWRDAFSIDTDLAGKEKEFAIAKSPIERRADNEATEMLLDPKAMTSFIQRVAPMYSKERIIQFANRMKIHPGIIVGQLQHRGEIGWHSNRNLLVKVREVLTSTAITDGWGSTLPA